VSRLCLTLALLLAACGDSRPIVAANTGSNGAVVGPRTNTTTAGCAAAGPGLTGLTYAGFAQGFFQDNCVFCHSASKTGAARNGAPTSLGGLPLNFDTRADILPLTAQIDEVAAMNPDGSVKNATMPAVGLAPVFPSDLERQKLACWIAEGTP
jgi:hypothetical protein